MKFMDSRFFSWKLVLVVTEINFILSYSCRPITCQGVSMYFCLWLCKYSKYVSPKVVIILVYNFHGWVFILVYICISWFYFLTHCGLQIWSCWILLSLVQYMVCCLFGTKLLPKPMMTYCQWTPPPPRNKHQWNLNWSTELRDKKNKIGPCLSWGMISTTCTVSVSRNDWKCQSIYALWKQLCMLCIG